MSVLDEHQSDLERAQTLINILIDRATGGISADHEYDDLRRYFVMKPEIRTHLPNWFSAQRSLNQFWNFIQPKYPSYAERRSFLYQEFEPVLKRLEFSTTTPPHTDIADGLDALNSEKVKDSWARVVQRTANDPEGAITASRHLLETVMKHILDACNVPYDDNKIELYKLVQKELGLAPEQHQEDIFKKILGGCAGVVNGLGTLRNKLGDAHGTGVLKVRPSIRHAQLACNLAGSMSLFLVDTYVEKRN